MCLASDAFVGSGTFHSSAVLVTSSPEFYDLLLSGHATVELHTLHKGPLFLHSLIRGNVAL